MIPDRNTFEAIYAGQPPWDIGKPQKPFIDVADRITGTVLDAGCGTGDTALFLAGQGCRVTGIDFLEVPIHRAQRKAAERGAQVTFLVKDAMTLKDWTVRFDNVIWRRKGRSTSSTNGESQGPLRPGTAPNASCKRRCSSWNVE